MGKLTVRAIESAKPKEKPYKLMDGEGLQLRIATDGIKTWLVRYMINGTERQYRLPRPYRDTGGDGFASLSDAREDASKIRALARQGVDFQNELLHRTVAAARQADQQAEEDKTQGLTIENMFNAWIADGVRRKDGNAMLLRMFKADVLPVVGAIAVKEVTEHHLRAALRKMVERGVNRSAVMTYANLVQMFAWAHKRQPWRKLMVEGDPMELIEIDKIVAPGYDMDNYRDRVLAPDEIRELRDLMVRMQEEYDAAPNKRVAPQPLEKTTQRGIWIMLSTLCRVGEMSMARWEHVDLVAGEWFIPKANVKDNVADLTVYLSPFSLEQFKALHTVTGRTEWCFPNRAATGHLDVKSISKQLGDRQVMFKKGKDGEPRSLKGRRNDNTLVLAGGANGTWTPHDLRRTGATMMQQLGVSLDIIDRCQNHVLSGSKVRRHYLHHDYRNEKRAAWNELGCSLKNLISQKKGN